MFSRLRSLQTILLQGRWDELPAELDGLMMENRGEAGLEALIEACYSRDYSRAEHCIQQLMQAHRPPMLRGDHDLTGLRTALRLTETRLSVAGQRKQQLLRRINAFRLKHNHEVGDLMARLLYIRRELLHMEMLKEPDKASAWEEARQEYQEWQQARSQAAPLVRPALDARQQKELSVLYRKISKRCHPDLVHEEQREDAARIFHRLNAAYVAADLEAMHQLLKLLEEGGLPLARKDRGVTEVERLTLQLRRMEQEVAMLLREIAEVEESAIWQLVSTLEDEDAYFSRIRDRLSRELEKEEREYERRRSAPTE